MKREKKRYLIWTFFDYEGWEYQPATLLEARDAPKDTVTIVTSERLTPRDLRKKRKPTKKHKQ